MTTEEQALLDELLHKFPRFAEYWEKYEVSENELFGKDVFDPPIYEVAWIFSEFVIDAYQESDFATVENAFLEIENVVENGSEHMSEVALVGFVEGVLFLRSHRKIPVDAFDEWLGKYSKKHWYDMHNFYTKGTPR